MKDNISYEEFPEEETYEKNEEAILSNHSKNKKTTGEGIQRLFIMQLIACTFILISILALKSFNQDLYEKFKQWYQTQINCSIMADDTDNQYSKAINNITNLVKIKINGKSKVQASSLKKTLAKPINEATLTNRFSKEHKGIDLAAAKGTDITSVADGTVEEAGFSESYGNYIKIDHGNNLKTLYAHCESLLVKENDNITKGQKIATVGSTGDSTGDHLHFEVIINNEYVDPLPLIDGDYT